MKTTGAEHQGQPTFDGGLALFVCEEEKPPAPRPWRGWLAWLCDWLEEEL